MRERRLLVILFLCSAHALLAQSLIPNNPGVKPLIAIRNAAIHPVATAPIPNGTIVFSNGVISAIGADVQVPAGATVIDGSGLSVYPGMIDSGSSVGLIEIDSVPGTVDTAETGNINPGARAAVALNPHSELIPVTRVNGVTHVVSVPEGGLVSGQSALIQLAGWTPEEMVVRAPAGLHIRFPRLRSSDEASDPDEEKKQRKAYEGEVDSLRKLFDDARAWVKAAGVRGNVHRTDRDLQLEALAPVVQGTVPVVLHARLERDIRAALAFAKEMDVRTILAGPQDVAPFVAELKARNIPVILGPILALPAREDDPYDILFSNAKLLHDNGILFSIQSLESHNTRNLPYHAAACAAFGLPKDAALAAITLRPAQIFGVADRLGSLEVGKAANLIVTDGDPLEIRTTVKQVFIAGEPISMDDRHKLLYEKFSKRP